VAGKNLQEWLTKEIDSITGSGGAGMISPRVRECLADAFATYMMGPAYAYATTILLLEPVTPFECCPEQPADDVRARVIISMLRQMDKNPAVPMFKESCDHLEAAWNAAKEQFESKVDDRGPEIDADFKQADVLVTALWNVLEQNISAPLTREAWNQVTDLKGALVAGKRPDLQTGAELRQVLNAAWLARVDPQRGPNIDLTTLTNAARDLASQTIQLKVNSTPAGLAPRRGLG
jgi:hypothetical protein